MGWLVLNPFSFFYSFFFRGESCIWSPCFLFIVIQIRIFRWNYSLNNFRLLRFVNMVCLLLGSIEPNTSAMRQLLHHRSAEYTFFHETNSSITFTWCINIFFLLNTFFFFFVRLSYVWTRFLFLYFEHWIFCRLLV